MNKVFLSGVIANDPSYTCSENGIERFSFQLCIKHRTQSGIIHKEYYPINAWNETAKWAKANLRRGSYIGLQGYLTQKNKKSADGSNLAITNIAVDEFIIGATAERNTDSVDNASAINEIISDIPDNNLDI